MILMLYLCFLLVCNSIRSKTNPKCIALAYNYAWHNPHCICVEKILFLFILYFELDGDLKYNIMLLERQASILPLELRSPILGAIAKRCIYCVKSVLRIKISYGIQYLCFLLMCNTIEQPCLESIAHTWLGHQYSIVSAWLWELAWSCFTLIMLETLFGFVEDLYFDCVLLGKLLL